MLPNINFVVSRARNSWGMAYYKFDWKNDTIIPEKIAISNYYDSPENVKIQTLLHEMIHIADYMASRKYIGGLQAVNMMLTDIGL